MSTVTTLTKVGGQNRDWFDSNNQTYTLLSGTFPLIRNVYSPKEYKWRDGNGNIWTGQRDGYNHFCYQNSSPDCKMDFLFFKQQMNSNSQVSEGGSRKSFAKTTRIHTNKNGVKYIIYVKDGNEYIRKKSKTTGKFTYRKLYKSKRV